MEERRIVEERSEIVFIYDCKWINPNGDPLEENKPRVDIETGRNIVTDVRLKRTIRDYLHEGGKNILVVERRDEDGYLFSGKQTADIFVKKGGFRNVREKVKAVRDKIISDCIDVRLFGATLPVKLGKKGSSVKITGPVQFRYGCSLHKVGEPKFMKGTGAFASQEEKEQQTFREEYVLPYSLICFYGIINENAAKETNLTENDVNLLLEAMWKGTKNLITRTKIGQMPRLLLRVIYREKNFHMGDLDREVELIKKDESKEDEALRDISEVRLCLTTLLNKLNSYKDKISKIEMKVDGDTIFIIDDEEVKGGGLKEKFKEKLKNIEVSLLSFN
jgi:CRISPR-associated protein Csh2